MSTGPVIYQTDDGVYTIADGGGYRTGVFATREAAEAALDVDETILERLQRDANRREHLSERVITLDMLVRMTSGPQPHVLTWDWKEQPDLDELARILTDVSGGTVHLRPFDTKSDDYAVVISTRPIDDTEAADAYSHRFDGEE